MDSSARTIEQDDFDIITVLSITFTFHTNIKIIIAMYKRQLALKDKKDLRLQAFKIKPCAIKKLNSHTRDEAALISCKCFSSHHPVILVSHS